VTIDLTTAREEVLQRGLTKLGWHADFMPRNVRGCEQGANCGYCNYGCRYGAKQSTVKTWLADADAAGARILVRTRADKVTVEGGTATGVEARTDAGHRGSVRARADSLAGLESAHGYLQGRVASELRLKNTPQVEFRYDDTADRGQRISELLREEQPPS